MSGISRLSERLAQTSSESVVPVVLVRLVALLVLVALVALVARVVLVVLVVLLVQVVLGSGRIELASTSTTSFIVYFLRRTIHLKKSM